MTKPTIATIAWAAGFLDGEGHFRFDKGHGNFRIICAQVDRRPLDKLCDAFGGKVYGPYGPYSTTKQAYFQWTIFGPLAEKATKLMMKYFAHKQEQAKKAIKETACLSR